MSWTRTPVSTSIRVSVARRLRNAITPTPVTNIASVESMNGAPRIAPTPTSWAASLPLPKMIAMTGIIVSGSAVPTAASTDPTAPWARFSLRPNHSMPLVNSSAPSRITRNAMTRIAMSIRRAIWAAATIDSATTSTTRAETSASRRSPAAKKPAPATTTRPMGRAMTITIPAQMNPIGWSPARSAGIAGRSNGGIAPWASGSVPDATRPSTPMRMSPIAR